MTETQIKHMVNRFLSWRLPADFSPDGGISFEKFGSAGTPYEYKREPSGTNVLNYQQAEAMVRYMLADLPSSIPVDDKAELDRMLRKVV